MDRPLPPYVRPPRPRRNRWTTILVLLFLYLAWRAPGDLANTYIAYGIYKSEQGDPVGAEAAFEKSRRWSRDSFSASQVRCAHYESQGQFERALKEWQAVMEEHPREPELRLQASEWMLRLGRQAEAVRTAEEAVKIAEEELALTEQEGNTDRILNVGRLYSETLNGLAYTRARVNDRIELGLVEIEEALSLRPRETPDHMLDTRGYLRYLHGDYAAALSDMEQCVRKFREQYHRELVVNRWQREGLVNREAADRAIRAPRHNLAVGYHHLGLVREALGQKARAAEDLAHAKQLGYDPAAGVW